MGSTSDLPVLRKAADFLEQMQVPFEMKALLTAHPAPSRNTLRLRPVAASR